MGNCEFKLYLIIASSQETLKSLAIIAIETADISFVPFDLNCYEM